MLAQAKTAVGERIVAGDDGAALAGRDVLGRVEREAGGFAGASDGTPAVDGTERVAGVFDEETVGAQTCAQGVEIGDVARIMDRDDPARALRKTPFEIFRVERQRRRIDVDEDGASPRQQDGIRRREEGERGNQDLVPRSDTEGLEGDLERRGSARDRDRAACAGRRAQTGLEGRRPSDPG